MGAARQEIEAKFWVRGLAGTRERLLAAGAHAQNPACLEMNWRFDTPAGELQAAGRVLRLRRSSTLPEGIDPDLPTAQLAAILAQLPSRASPNPGTLTFKRPTDEPHNRAEHELPVGDCGAAQQLLLALGYSLLGSYEKLRQVLDLNGCQVMLDRLPYGAFIEIEGPSLKPIIRLAGDLSLMWSRRSSAGYWQLFARLRESIPLPFGDASFANFADLDGAPLQSLGLELADRPDPAEPGP